jgi:hypothetical protein
MFKDTNEFFEEVSKGKVALIDILNYISSITDEFKIDKLRALLYSIESYIRIRTEFLEEEFEKIVSYLQDGDASQKYEDNVYKHGTLSEIRNYPQVFAMYNRCENLKDIEKIYMSSGLIALIVLHNNVKSRIEQQTKEQTISSAKIETNTPPPPKELHTSIFNNNGFVLFEYLLVNYVENNLGDGRYADISYYYRVMAEKKKYITANIKDFIDWFLDTYDDNITKIKARHLVENGIRGENYTTALVWFKSPKE